jgi:hypothetical protein
LKNLSKKAIIIMPTIPGREASAIKVINIFLSQNVGKIIVLLNGHSQTRARMFPKNPIINYKINPPRTGPISRYEAINTKSTAGFNYIFTVDDDIEYPSDYVSKNIDLIDRFGSNYILSYHSHYWEKNLASYKARKTYRVEKETNNFDIFHFGGSGASVFSRASFEKIISSKIPKRHFEYNDDIWLAAFAASMGLKFLRPPTKANWIKIQHPHPVNNLYNKEMKNNFKNRNAKLHMAIKKYGVKLNYKGSFEGDKPIKNKEHFDITIYIKSFNRARYALKLINDIVKNKQKYKIKVILIDDCSSQNYSSVKNILNKNGWEYTRLRKNHGRQEAWMVSNVIYSDVKNRTSKYFMVFPDDIRLCENFFNIAIKYWESIADINKVSMVLAKDSGRDKGRGPGPCWTGFNPVLLNNFVWKTGWVDEFFIAEEKYFRKMNYQISKIPKARFSNNKNISSGVGRDASVRLHGAGFGLYCVNKSLAVFVNCNSEMNPEERKVTPLKTLDFVMGEKKSKELENE